MHSPSPSAWRAAKALSPDGRGFLRAIDVSAPLEIADMPMELITRDLADYDLAGAWLTELGREVCQILGTKKAGAGFPGRPAGRSERSAV